MAPPYLLIVLFLAIASSSNGESVEPTSAKNSYVRPPPRPLIYLDSKGVLDNDPDQVHVSLVGNDHMRVTWITKHHTAPSLVEYGTSSGKYTSSAKGEPGASYRYFFYKSGYIHNVVIGPLKPDTVYYYMCGESGKEYSLKTPPSQYPITFVVAGDLGQTGWTKTTLDNIKNTPHDVLLIPGDLSYADLHQPLWDSFGRLVEPLASSRPWMVTQGNHEIEAIPIIHKMPFKAYNARWRMPYEESGSTSNLYYSFNVVGAHIIMLGSYTEFDSDSDQYKWLQGDLAKVDRKKTPWVFALIHAPWYNTNYAHSGEGEDMRKAMESLLYSNKVDMVFAGHVHAYERFTRVYDNKADSCGPIHFTVGDGGNREGLALAFQVPKPKLSLFREASFGHGVLKIYNETDALWTWHRNQDDEDVFAEEFYIKSLITSAPSCGGKSPPSKSLSRDEL